MHSLSSPPEDWPTQGKIKFENYSGTYTECREPALKDLHVKIDKHSLVAVVGRAGSGKSTLALSLFNAVKSANGRILIDNVDISKIGLKSLRQSLSIYPQESALFTGEVRFNLDPEEIYKDSELWTVLEYVGLKDQSKYLNTVLMRLLFSLNS